MVTESKRPDCGQPGSACSCAVPPASADPAVAAAADEARPTRRSFLRSSGMLSMSSLMGTATL
ncbi:MAG: hypothetical protein AB7U92_22820, partial [Piscinibacter sp.]|uniref:hypothetical protein n=1 Tax=Piscinibacter sp. TaxID=1903157 RepID=UPI003D14F790